ncbi:MAG: DNA-3-methyladenine glycosylase [Pirellulaceae bacterium]|nr:DNA-3-methyladenine glycosylase [Pirellulaceae bacterium]
MNPLPRDFYARDPISVARDLLGKVVVRHSPNGIAAGRIVEVEAYLSRRDPACHAHRGMTKRNATMFGPAGHAYVYTIHTRWCLNAVTEAVGEGSAVLIRALEPLAGIDLMQARRRREKLLDLARGPGRLCQALAIDKQYDGWDLTGGTELWIAHDSDAGDIARQIVRAPRIGISRAKGRLLRFFLAGNRFVSGRRAIPAPASR